MRHGPEVHGMTGYRTCNGCADLEEMDGVFVCKHFNKPECKRADGKTKYEFQLVREGNFAHTPRKCPFYR